MNKFTDFCKKNLTYLAVAATVLYFGYFMVPRADRAGEFKFRDFGLLPSIDQGRLKPLDTVARMNLMVIMHRQQLYDADTGNTYPAIKWLLDCMTTPMPKDAIANLFPADAGPGVAFRYKVFRIESDEVLQQLNLERREGLRYSFIDIAPGFAMLMNKARDLLGDEEVGIQGKDRKAWTVADAKYAELYQHLNIFRKLAAHGGPLLIPNADGSDQWKTFRDVYYENGFETDPDNLPDNAEAKAYAVYIQLLTAYQAGSKTDFNRTLDSYLADLDKTQPARMTRMRIERFFNEFAPFWYCLLIYLVFAVMGAVSWLPTPWSEPIRKAAFSGMAVAFVAHLSGLVLRMYLQDRMFVFVTNLYSSAVFIGLGCVFIGLIGEWLYRNGIAVVVGSATGFCTLFIAHLLGLDGDTMVMMQAVLDTNFWLATHVTCVTLGYVTVIVAGFMGIAYILLGIFTNMLRKQGSADLTRMTYGVLCAGMFLSFVGTVLGGLWADYSWGRFWGWDPKENGALLIVIWVALILHARWGGLVRHRGIAVLSVLGIIVTSWSWFGTNFLGIGLHAYGGAKANAMLMLQLIDLGFLAIAGLGLLPLHHWQSFCPLSELSNGPLKPTVGMPTKPASA
jgi:ABC-type transport system involved in cytochrome c biogenesis permease subunit